MEIVIDINNLIENKPSVITLGNFDGLHLGHQMLVKTVINLARSIQGRSVVFTFTPHPLKVLAPDRCPPLINIREEKIQLFRSMGIDLLILAPFTVELSKKSPEAFVEEILWRSLHAKVIVVGQNYRFGKDRRGNVRFLKEMGMYLGFDVLVTKPFTIDNEMVSSTKIRQFLKKGEVEHAARLMGRPYQLKGKVVKGDGRGRLLGFPTANILPVHEIIPCCGVYATKARIECIDYDSITNIGYRPTFCKETLCVETHIFGFNRSIYDYEITISFVARLRKEKKFDTPEQLIKQIQKDTKQAKILLKNNTFQDAILLNPSCCQELVK